MMKIKTEDAIYRIPVSSGVYLTYEMNDKTEILELIFSYFGQKKKTKCIVLDEDDNLISPMDAEIIYLGKKDISAEFDFKPKTDMNAELTAFITNNTEMFESIDVIRDGMKELITDMGMYRLNHILTTGTDISLKFDAGNFDVSKIFQNLRIDVEEMSDQQMRIMLYNLYLFLNRYKYTILYIDHELDETSIKWLMKIKNPDLLVFVENSCIDACQAGLFDGMVIVNNSEMIERLEYQSGYASKISYLFHPVVLRNLDFQNKKILNLWSDFSGCKETFLIEFTNEKDAIIL